MGLNAVDGGGLGRFRCYLLGGLSAVAFIATAQVPAFAQGSARLDELSVSGGGRRGGGGNEVVRPRNPGSRAARVAAPSAPRVRGPRVVGVAPGPVAGPVGVAPPADGGIVPEGGVRLSPSSLGTTADGRINPPASALGKAGEESPVGPVNGYVATRTGTGTKTNTSILKSPQSVSVVGQEQIRATGASNLSEALRYTPGVYANRFGPDSRLDWFILRGFVANETGLYRDGLQLLNNGFAYFRAESFGLERIEVMRGPSSVLFGSGTPGGMINMVTKRPTLLPFNYVEAGVDNFGQAYGGFDFGGPADDSGHWFYRLTGIGRGGGTQVNDIDSNRVYIAPALTYKPDGATSFTLLANYQHDWTGVTNNFLPYSGSVVRNQAGLFIPRDLNVSRNFNKFEREQVMAGYEFEHAVNDILTLRQNFRYSFQETGQNSLIGNGYADTAQTQLARYQFRVGVMSALAQVDNQAQFDFSDGFFGHRVLAGLDFKDYRLHDQQGTRFPAESLNLLNPVDTGINGPTSSYRIVNDNLQQTGLYVQDQVRVTDRFTITGGVRQDFVNYESLNKLGGTTRTTQDDKAFTYRVAGVYEFDYGIAPYVSYATSFAPQVGVDALRGNALLRPDEGKQVEVGLRVQPVGQGWYFAVAGFDLERQNPALAVPGTFNTTQLGAIRSRGVEAEFVANFAEGLNVVASVTHYDLEFTNLTDPALASLRGKTPNQVPETFANAFLDYTIPTGDWRGFGFGGGVRYVGRSFVDNANTQQVPNYTLFDATVHYEFLNGWRAAITASNIGDKRFVSSCNGDVSCYYGEARRVVGSISYKW